MSYEYNPSSLGNPLYRRAREDSAAPRPGVIQGLGEAAGGQVWDAREEAGGQGGAREAGGQVWLRREAELRQVGALAVGGLATLGKPSWKKTSLSLYFVQVALTSRPKI